MRAQRLTTVIFIGMVLGIFVGYACNVMWPDPQTAKAIAGYISLMTDIFLRLIKMIIAPLVFSTLVVGVAHMGDTKAIGRIGLKAMAWFVSASLVSLLLGMVMVNLLRPGDNLNLPLPDADAATNLKVASLSLKEFITHLVPKSAVEAMAKSGATYHVVGDFLSYDPYALMFRKDDADFALVVERSFARLAASREIVQLYDKWFLQRLPSGERLGLAMSPQLEEFFRVLGAPE